VVLVVMNIVAMLVSRLVKSAGLAVEDRLLGSVFGLARGVVVILVLVLGAGLTVLPRQPVWKDAMLAAPLEKLALLVKQWLPQEWAKNISYS
jgi:membrane protein required for colicin V production